MKQTNRKGFTLAELLIVVAIIAVLVAIAIPVFTSQLHNARVATDIANCRAYYAELQVDYMETGVKNPTVNIFDFSDPHYNSKSFTLLSGETIELEGNCYVYFTEGHGYRLVYQCKDVANHPDHYYPIGN